MLISAILGHTSQIIPPDYSGIYYATDGLLVFLDGKLHQKNQPAVQWFDGSEMWFQDGQKHRIDGPAVTINGFKEYWLYGNVLAKEQYEEQLHYLKAVVCRHELDVSLDYTGPVKFKGNKSLYFYSGGVKHRLDGPAVVNSFGITEWWVSGKRHRLNGPAYVDSRPGGFGKKWYYKGVLMSEEQLLNCKNDVLPIETMNSRPHPQSKYTGIGSIYGDTMWFEDGMIHNEYGPAIIQFNGSKFWMQLDKLHREDGPAVIYSDGKQEWWKEGLLWVDRSK